MQYRNILQYYYTTLAVEFSRTIMQAFHGTNWLAVRHGNCKKEESSNQKEKEPSISNISRNFSDSQNFLMHPIESKRGSSVLLDYLHACDPSRVKKILAAHCKILIYIALWGFARGTLNQQVLNNTLNITTTAELNRVLQDRWTQQHNYNSYLSI